MDFQKALIEKMEGDILARVNELYDKIFKEKLEKTQWVQVRYLDDISELEAKMVTEYIRMKNPDFSVYYKLISPFGDNKCKIHLTWKEEYFQQLNRLAQKKERLKKIQEFTAEQQSLEQETEQIESWLAKQPKLSPE